MTVQAHRIKVRIDQDSGSATLPSASQNETTPPPPPAYRPEEKAVLDIHPAMDIEQLGTQFQIIVDVASVSDLYAFELSIAFDPSELRVDGVLEGDFLSARGATDFLPGTVDNTNGRITMIADTLLGGITGASGGGTLLVLNVTAIGTGLCKLDIFAATLLDSRLADISFMTSDSQVDIVPCFARGTMILTAKGEVAVESLRKGDVIVTLSGTAPIVWIGQRRVFIPAGSCAGKGRPIRITQGALSSGVPHQDLVVSPDHALFFRLENQRFLVQADTLVNGATILQDDCRHIEYFHIELSAHSIIVANGARVESYLDTGNRSLFLKSCSQSLFNQKMALPGSANMPCAPYLREGPLWLAVARTLINRAESLGWTQSTNPNISLLVDGRHIVPFKKENGRYLFSITYPHHRVRLLSQASYPSGTIRGNYDRRTLGIAVSEIILQLGDTRVTLDLDRVEQRDGFHAKETNEEVTWRWTDGAATLPRLPPAANTDAPLVLEVTLAQSRPYWVRPSLQYMPAA